MTSSLLNGLRVLELSEVWAGPMAGSLLGDLGADVIKVESYPRASQTRVLVEGATVKPGEGAPYERGMVHHLANRNKRNVAFNLRHSDAAEPFRRLVRSADVLYEGYSAGTIDAMGWGWETLHAINPRLVMVSMPGWGVQGPFQGYVTLGSGLDAYLGHTFVRGYPGDSPDDTKPVYHSDATGALALVAAVMTGLRRVEQTGEGCFIDMSQVEAMAWQLPGLYADWTMNGRVSGPLGNTDPHVVPHDVYQAAGDDSWVFVAAEDDRQWAGLASALGHPEWAADGHPWATVTGRLRARDAVDTAVAAFTRERAASDVADAVQAAGAIAAPATRPAELPSSPQMLARDWFQMVVHECAGANIMPGFLWSIAPDAPSWDRVCGLVGEHMDEVLAEAGYSAAEIAALEAAGAIGRGYPMPAGAVKQQERGAGTPQ
ncbi:MAG: CoA transferase [Chloroflexi bacterium]|nr:CoA transferase [Chloroflexota bacterium]MDA1239690.1 CoA transferase [Chloroflexota bacterium]